MEVGAEVGVGFGVGNFSEIKKKNNVVNLMGGWEEEHEPKHTLKSQPWPAETNAWLLRGWDENGWEDYDFKEEDVHRARRDPGGLRFHVSREPKGGTFFLSQAINWEPCTQNLSYYSTYVDIRYNHIYMCFLDCDKVVFYSLLYRWCKL